MCSLILNAKFNTGDLTNNEVFARLYHRVMVSFTYDVALVELELGMLTYEYSNTDYFGLESAHTLGRRQLKLLKRELVKQDLWYDFKNKFCPNLFS